MYAPEDSSKISSGRLEALFPQLVVHYLFSTVSVEVWAKSNVSTAVFQISQSTQHHPNASFLFSRWLQKIGNTSSSIRLEWCRKTISLQVESLPLQLAGQSGLETLNWPSEWVCGRWIGCLMWTLHLVMYQQLWNWIYCIVKPESEES